MKKLKSYQYERYALLCRLSYPDSFDHTQYGFAPEGQKEINDAFGCASIRVLWGDKKEAVIVFRGSQSLPDWLVNFAFLTSQRQIDDVRYRVHWGYAKLLEQTSKEARKTNDSPPSVFEQIVSEVERLINMGKRISLTGHSSGGAMAVLAADRLERLFPGNIKRVVTFGQPAAGTWSFRKHYALPKRTYRICCDLDIVTFMPPVPWLYWHVGRMLWLHDDKIYENVSERFRLFKSITSWIMLPITYHSMRKYIRQKEFFDQH